MNTSVIGFTMLFALAVCHAATIEMVIRTDDMSEDYYAGFSRDHNGNYGADIPNDHNTNLPEAEYTNLPETDYTNLPETDYTYLAETDYTNLPEMDYTNLHGVDYTNLPEADYKNLPDIDHTNLPETDYTSLPEMDYTNLHGVDYSNLPEMDYTDMPEVLNTDQSDEYTTEITDDKEADMYKDLNTDSLIVYDTDLSEDSSKDAPEVNDTSLTDIHNTEKPDNYDMDISEDYSTDCSKDYGVGYEPDLTLDEDPSQIPPGSLDIDGNVFDRCRVSKTLRVTNGGKWGRWGEAKFCPAGSFAAGYDMKIERSQYLGDDTSLNGIKIVCKNLEGQYAGEAASSVGTWGSWVGRKYCKRPHSDSSDYLTSFSLQVEESQGKWGDDTAANYVKFTCRGKCNSRQYTLMKRPEHGSWGKWGNWSLSCPVNTAVCGIKNKVEMKQHGWDDTALNDAIFYCCK